MNVLIKKSINAACNIYRVLLFTLFVSLFLQLSCKKDTDTQHPVITYNSPYELQDFEVLDIIPVIADISDEHIIEYVKVDLVDSEFSPVLPAVYFYPKTTNYHLDIDYPIDDAYLKSGEYYIHIKAEDGTNFKNQYQLIWINGIPRQFDKLVVLTQPDFNTIEISEIDKSDNFNFLFDIDGDYSGSEINSRYQQLYIAGKEFINLNTYDLNTLELDWFKESFPPVPMHNDDCLYFDEDLYVTFNTNYIYGFRHNGAQSYNSTVENDKSPSRLATFNEFLLVDLQSKTGGITYLSTFYLVTGAEKQRITTNYKVVEFFKIDDNNVLIAGNSSGEGVLIKYDPYANIATTLLPVPGKIACIEKLPYNKFIIGTDNSILFYDHEQNSLTSILPGKVAYRIQFDETENNIYTVAPKLIEKIKYPQMLSQKLYPLPDSIFNIHLLYNK